MWYVSLDEWAGLGYEDEGSCRQVMFDNFYNAASIAGDRITTFDGRDCDLEGQCGRVDEWISEKGGIGLTVLGVGMNGHLGFNEPGIETFDKCIIVNLDNTTLNIGKKYFNGAACPTMGITVGLGHLLKAESVALIASGEKKAAIVWQAVEGGMTNPNPASLLQSHNNTYCFFDKGAASMLKTFNRVEAGSVINEVLPQCDITRKRIMLFDLADFSARNRKEFLKALNLLESFKKWYYVVLSLNENEAKNLIKMTFPSEPEEGIIQVIQKIMTRVNVDLLVIHTLNSAFAVESGFCYQSDSFYVQKPRISTGGGDNFNGGLSAGLLMGLDVEMALILANAVSGYYVRNAKSPSIDDIKGFLEQAAMS